MSDNENVEFIKELERKSAFAMWQDYCEMKEELQKVKQERDALKSVMIKAAAFTLIECQDEDIPEINAERLRKNVAFKLREAAINKIGDV